MFYLCSVIRNIRRHKRKSILSCSICLATIFLLNIYSGNIQSSRGQLDRLSEAIPVNGRVSNLCGTDIAGLKIKDEFIEYLLTSSSVKNPEISVRMDACQGVLPQSEWEGKLDIHTAGVNTVKAIPGLLWENISLYSEVPLDFLMSDNAWCLLDKSYMRENGVKPGDEVKLTFCYYDYVGRNNIEYKLLETAIFRIAGSMEITDAQGQQLAPQAVIPLQWVRNSYGKIEADFYAEAASFEVAEPLKLNAFKREMREMPLIEVVPTADYALDGNALIINDETFIGAATQLMENISLLEEFMPFVFILTIVIGFITSWLLMQGRRTEYATMRSVGVSRTGCFGIFFMENSILNIIGGLLGALLSLFFVSVELTEMAVAFGASVLCYLCGTAVALWLVGRCSILTVLTEN